MTKPKVEPCCPACLDGDRAPHVVAGGKCCCFHTAPPSILDEENFTGGEASRPDPPDRSER